MRSTSTTNPPIKDKRTDFSRIHVSGAVMTGARSDLVNYAQANLSAVNFDEANLSLCSFEGTNLNRSSLRNATMIMSEFSEETSFDTTDVTGVLMLFARNTNGRAISREWLAAKGAVNAELAITSLSDLSDLLNNSKIDMALAEKLKDRINAVNLTVESARIRKSQGMFMKPEWHFLLKYATDVNLRGLRNAYNALITFLFKTISSERIVIKHDTLLMLIAQHQCPSRLMFMPDLVADDNKMEIERVKPVLSIGLLPEKLTIDIKHADLEFVKEIINFMEAKSYTRLHVLLDCADRYQKYFTQFMSFLKSRAYGRSLTVEFAHNLNENLAREIISLVSDAKSGYGLQCNIADPNVVTADADLQMALKVDLMSAIEMNNIRQAALACVTLCQGQHEKEQPLSALPLEVLNMIFSHVLPEGIAPGMKSVIIKNSYKLCPEGRLFAARPAVAAPAIAAKTAAFGFKPGFLNRK